MLQVNYILQHKEEVLKRLAIKNFNDIAMVDEIIKTDEERRKAQTELDQLLAKMNAASKEIGQLKGNEKEIKELGNDIKGLDEFIKEPANSEEASQLGSRIMGFDEFMKNYETANKNIEQLGSRIMGFDEFMKNYETANKNIEQLGSRIKSFDEFVKNSDIFKKNIENHERKIKSFEEFVRITEEKRKEDAFKYKERTSDLQMRKNDLEEKLKSLLFKLPNLPNESVPLGNSPEENVVVRSGGENIKLSLNAKPHWELASKYKIIDFELGNKITGAGFPVYMGKGAQLQRALITYFLSKANEAGYLEIQPPLMVNEESGIGTGQLPDKDSQMYHVKPEGFYLIPTAEVPLTNIYRDVMVKEEELPIKLTGYTPCFRREAGSYGAHVRGLNRLHQFDKVEIVQIVRPDNSYQVLDEMVSHVENLVKSLGLKYRILRLCGGDMSFASALTYDFEVYSAAQDKWLEVSSVSNFETFQSNRMKMRYKDRAGKTQLTHTLNGSALALPRIVAAILECNQKEDGIHIPEVLHQYTGWKVIS